MDAGKAVEPATHLGTELEKLTKMIGEAESRLGMPIAEVKDSVCHGPELSGALAAHIDTVMRRQSETARIITEVGLLHSILA